MPQPVFYYFKMTYLGGMGTVGYCLHMYLCNDREQKIPCTGKLYED